MQTGNFNMSLKFVTFNPLSFLHEIRENGFVFQKQHVFTCVTAKAVFDVRDVHLVMQFVHVLYDCFEKFENLHCFD